MRSTLGARTAAMQRCARLQRGARRAEPKRHRAESSEMSDHRGTRGTPQAHPALSRHVDELARTCTCAGRRQLGAVLQGPGCATLIAMMHARRRRRGRQQRAHARRARRARRATSPTRRRPARLQPPCTHGHAEHAPPPSAADSAMSEVDDLAHTKAQWEGSAIRACRLPAATSSASHLCAAPGAEHRANGDQELGRVR